MDKPRNIVGPKVRQLRSRAGLSQPALAARCQRIGWDVSRDIVAKIEDQRRWVADFELFGLARALGVKLIDLFPSDAVITRAFYQPQTTDR